MYEVAKEQAKDIARPIARPIARHQAVGEECPTFNKIVPELRDKKVLWRQRERLFENLSDSHTEESRVCTLG